MVMTFVYLNDLPAFQIHILLALNMGHLLFIFYVKPLDEYRKWMGNTGVIIKGLITHLLLYTIASMILVVAQTKDAEKLLYANHCLTVWLHGIIIGFLGFGLGPILYFMLVAKILKWAKNKYAKCKSKKA